MTRADYMAMVETAKEYIRAGEIFQVVPSMRLRMPFRLPPFALYRALRRLNPSPFLFFLDFGDFSVVGSSPEILVRVRDNKVTHPPARRHATTRRQRRRGQGARRRASGRSQGARRASHAARSRPQRCRPRVARSARSRSPSSFVIERYSHVMHICSHVEGQLDPKYDALGRADRGLPRRHAVGRAQGARDGDHRRAGDRAAQPLWRRDRLFRGRRQHGHVHRAAHRHRQGRA